jgi:nucleoside-diphosphate-sugar epimerase
MDSEFTGPVNIGSDQMISINALTRMVIKLAGKRAGIKNIPGPQGVRGRNSDNTLIKEKLGWEPTQPLYIGLEKTYKWIQSQMFS